MSKLEVEGVAKRFGAVSVLDGVSFAAERGEVLAELVPAVYDEALAAREGGAWMAEWDRTIRGRGAPSASSDR